MAGPDRNSTGETLFSLFNGDIFGTVRNPVTGVVHHRRDLLDHYKFLIGRSIDDPANIRFRKLVRIIADLLEIPADIHDELIKEAWRDRSLLGHTEVNEKLMSDLNSMYDHLTGERFYIRPGSDVELSGKDPETDRTGEARRSGSHGILDDHHGIFDQELASTYSLLSEMEEDDISVHLESKVMEPSVDSPFGSSGWIKSGKGHTFQ